MTKYLVKSPTKKFKNFTIADNGLGYLVFNIYESISVQLYGELGKIIGCQHVHDSDILIKEVGSSKWCRIKFKRNSSESYLEPI